MNGLECSEIMLSNLERTTRIDAEFYAKNNLRVLDILSKYSLDKITDNYYVSDGNHMSVSDSFVDVGVPYYRGQDIYNVFIEDSSPICIDKKTYTLSTMMRSWLKKGDVLLSIVGAIIGNTAIVSSYKEATCSCKLAILRAKTKNDNYYYLHSFIKSKYGQNQIQKFRRGAAQTGLLLEDMDQIFIPNLGDKLKKYISDIYVNVYRLINSAKKCYSDAEQILLKSLNMDNFVPSQKNTTTKFLSQFMNAGRLDAEYFQPKYDELQEILNSQISSPKLDRITTLESIVNIFKSIEPGSAEYCASGVPFVRVSNVSKYGISSPSIYLDKKLWGNLGLQPKKDTILFSKDGSVGIAYKVDKNIECITSSALLHLTVIDSNVLPDYLTLVLNSLIVKMQSERDVGGSIIQHWRIDDIKKVVIPILTMDIQKEIAYKVQKSFELREKGNELLEAAKKAVEIAIEENEETAIQYLAQFECVGKEV